MPVRFRSYFTCALLGLALPSLQGAEPIKVKVVALGDKGAVGDIAAQDWKVKVAGKDAQVLAQRAPAETEKDGQKWAFVLLPIRDPEYRENALFTLATFMTSLPPSDSVLVALRTDKGLECLTPGFSVRPSVWAKALDQARELLGARLPGNSEAVVNFVPASGKEPGEDSMAPVTGFLARLAAKKIERRADDMNTIRKSVTELYAYNDLAGYTGATVKALKSLEAFGEVLGRETGEKHIIVFSRNEIDDLANPAWARMHSTAQSGNSRRANSGRAEDPGDTLQVGTMVRDITLAFHAFKEKMAKLGLDVHSVGVAGAGYNGAFSDVAAATGGTAFTFNADLAKRLPAFLTLWAAPYELKVAIPDGVARPVAVAVESPRKGVKLFTPTLQ